MLIENVKLPGSKVYNNNIEMHTVTQKEDLSLSR